MSYKLLAAAPLLLLTACGDSGGGDESATPEAAGAPVAVALTGETGFQTAVDCHAKLTAVSRLFQTIADSSTGAEQQEMADTAAARDLTAFDYRGKADILALELGKTPEQVEAAVDAAHAAVDSEFQAREFGDFAIWLGAEADKCPPPTV